MSTPEQRALLIAEIGRATDRVNEARRKLSEFDQMFPHASVGVCFITELRQAPREKLMAQARKDAKWLAEKCVGDGRGAAHDSSEARIVQLLIEFCRRMDPET